MVLKKISRSGRSTSRFLGFQKFQDHKNESQPTASLVDRFNNLSVCVSVNFLSADETSEDLQPQITETLQSLLVDVFCE